MTQNNTRPPIMTGRIKRAWRASERLLRERALSIVITLIVVALTIVVLWPFIVTTVDSGQSAVLFRRFSGVEMNRAYGEGIYTHWPWNTFFVYDLRLQTERRTVDVLANNGLTVSLDIAVRYRVDYRRLPMLHRTIGPDYLQRIVMPQTIAALRGEVGKYTPEELYNTHEGLLDRASLEAIDETAERYVLSALKTVLRRHASSSTTVPKDCKRVSAHLEAPWSTAPAD